MEYAQVIGFKSNRRSGGPGTFAMTSNSQDIPYHLSLTPSDDPPNADLIYSAIGRVIVSWGLFESQLDFGLANILRIPEAEPIRKPVPSAFSDKMKLWRKAFQNISIFAEHEKEALTISDKATFFVKRRDAIVHGNWNSFEKGDPVKLIGVQVRFKNNLVTMRKHTATASGFNQTAKDIRDLSFRMVHLFRKVHRLIENHN
jgi:hypothetical protein